MQRLRNLLLMTTALMPFAVAPAVAGPNGATVVGGQATVQNPGTANVTVNQFTDKAIINWTMFNIGVGEKTTFNQPNSGSIALNRITGGLGPSEILGTLDANGRVFVVNRDGIIFGPGAVITTAGFLATTSDIKNEDFMAGRFNFQIPGKPDASVVNMGTITATNGGFAALVAPGVRNSGTITAKLGTVALGAGNLFNLDFYGDKLITLGVGDQIATQVKDVATGQTLKSLVTNDGKLKANGGRVELTAAAARTVVDAVINTSGVIEANSIGTKNGQIVLSAATASPAGAATRTGSGGGASGLPPQTVRVSGKLSAAGKRKGTTGGSIIVTGENIELAGATIDASGREGGGKVMIGGDWGGGNPNTSLVSNQSAKLEGFAIPNASIVSVDAATRIDASAKDRGDGGKVILWSDHTTSFAGTILAMGGKEIGNGGFAEVSSHGVLNYTGLADLRATNGSFGSLLLDPYNVRISTDPDNSGGLSGGVWTPSDNGSNISVTTLQNALALANVLVTTGGAGSPGSDAGYILVDTNAHVSWSAATNLTLSAYQNVMFSYGATITNTGSGNLFIRADNSGTGTGSVSFYPTTSFIDFTNSTGKVSIYYNPSGDPSTKYSNAINFSPDVHTNLSVPNQLAAYMLVNNVTDLSRINTNLAGTYALGNNIDATSVSNFAPLSTFTGLLDGNGGLGTNYTISNLTIAPTSPGVNNIGLFASIGSAGTVRNLNFDLANVTANSNLGSPGQFVGVLAGQNSGTISNVNVTNSLVTNGSAQSAVIAGGIVGQNQAGATIQNSGVNTVAVTVGDATGGNQENNAGGVAGVNHGTIANAVGTDVAILGGAHSELGGLVARNETDGSILSSSSSGAVAVDPSTGIQNVVGGLVGFNFGAIDNSSSSAIVVGAGTNVFFSVMLGGLVGMNGTDTINFQSGHITNSHATGTVIGGLGTTTGGFVGSNTGNATISNSDATGNVTSLDNFVGGFVGFNTATISGSHATGTVIGAGFGTGGFAGNNDIDNQNGHVGSITNSYATGSVFDASTNGSNTLGGFVGENRGTITASHATGGVFGNFGNINPQNGSTAGGFAGSNDGSIDGSYATGVVSVGAGSGAGGFVAANFETGKITNSQSSGAVTGANDTILGGFAGGNFGSIKTSSTTSTVNSTGANSIVGGFAGVNFKTIANSDSSGAVGGTSDSYLGGFVGINAGLVQDSTTAMTSNVTGTGANNIVGGFAGMNFGYIDPSRSSGNATSGPNSIVGGFVGANGAIQFPDGSQYVGTVSPDSGGNGQASGGSGSTVGPQVGFAYPTTGVPNYPGAACNNGGGFCGGSLFNPNGTFPAPPAPPAPPDQPQDRNIPQIAPLLNIAESLVSNIFTEKKQEEVISTSNGGAGGGSGGGPGHKGKGGPQGTRPALGFAAYGLGPLPSGMPPLHETRFRNDLVVFQLGGRLSNEELLALARRLGLTIVYQEDVGLLGRKVVSFRLPPGQTVRGIIPQLQALGANFSAQPAYQFELTQDVAQAPSPADTNRKGDSAQYVVEKLGLVEAHLIATGKNVKVAVIDSEIDANHPDLQGAVTGSYDALPSDDQSAHPHGTGMAGAIASHKRLLGVAPNAHLLAVRAFGVNTGGAQGTSMNIVKGLQWAVDQGAKVINMSFAGPRDPILQQAIKRLTDQGIILIAAAGNAGPKSAPLYPGADPNVIAVSATDMDDKTYKGSNRGKYIAVSAPGVDILVPAPEGGYQLTTGTSVAAAHVSGVVALMLERNKELKPAEVRAILAATAKNIGGVRTDVGAGLVDPIQALGKSGPKQARLH